MDKQRTVLVDKQYFLPFVLLTSLFFLCSCGDLPTPYWTY